MKRISKWLIPGFLRRIDAYLLENQPVIWRTRIHFVLFYTIASAIILFAIGYFYPIPYTEPIVDPIIPINITDEVYYKIPLAFGIIGILYWAYTQYQFPLQNSKTANVFQTLLMYAIGLYIIIAVTPSAFRMGTIVHTAYGWIEEEDIAYLEENDFFLYGFVLLEEDSIYQERTDTFFQRREMIFKDIWRYEDTILQNRYNQRFWDAYWERLVQKKIIDRSDRSDLLDRSYLSYLSYLLDRLDRSYLSGRLDRSDLSNRSDLSYRSDLWYRSDLSNRSYRSDLWYRSYMWDLSDLSDRSDLWYRSYLSDLSYRSDYSTYYQRTILSGIDQKLLDQYQIAPFFDTIQVRDNIASAYEDLDSIELIQAGMDTTIWSPDRLILVPLHVYQIEDAVRLVQHARLYLRAGILGYSLRSIILFLPFLCLLLFATQYLSLRLLLWAFFINIVGLIINLIIEIKPETLGLNSIQMNGYAYLMLPILSLVGLLISSILKKRNYFPGFLLHLQVVSIAGVLLFAIIGSPTLGMDKPVNLAFFGAQVIGLAGLLLMSYLQAQPKSS